MATGVTFGICCGTSQLLNTPVSCTLSPTFGLKAVIMLEACWLMARP